MKPYRLVTCLALTGTFALANQPCQTTRVAPVLGPSQDAEATGLHVPTLSIATADGPVVLGSCGPHGAFLAPLTSLSPEVVRGGFLRGEVQLSFEGEVKADDVMVVAVIHKRDEFVILNGSLPMVMGSVAAPTSARAPQPETGPTPPANSPTWDLGHLIRRDGHCVSGAALELAPPAAYASSSDNGAQRLLLFARSTQAGASERLGGTAEVDGVNRWIDGHPLRPLVLPTTGAPHQLQLGSAQLDAVMFATVVEKPPLLPLLHSQTTTLMTADHPSRVATTTMTFVPREAQEELLQGEDTAITLLIIVSRELAKPRFVEASSVDSNSVEATASPSTPKPDDVFVDVTFSRGMDAMHFEGEREQLDIRPTMGPGAAWGDVNSDGHLDAVILQGSGRPGTAPLHDRLYLGTRGGDFIDATSSAGLGFGDAGMGALLADINGDGDLDLYCANYGQDRLFLGGGDGTFQEATDLLPKLDLWSASVTAADPDGDGDLDLYITSYLDYDLEKMPPAGELGRYQREDPIEMLPFAFPGQRNVYLRNQLAETGELGFVDATEALGLLDVQGRGMQTVFWDFDLDGDEDLYIANDVSFNVLFRNEGDGTFKDVSFSTGLDDPRGGMGLAVGDIDRDGDEDIFLTNWQLEANALYLNSVVSHTGAKRRRASFHDATVRSGLGPSGIGKTSWGAELFDLDLDGDLDLYVANGYTSPDYESTGICVGQSDQLFLGDGNGKFAEPETLPAAIGGIEQASRGAIGADYDGDGDVDLLVTANNGHAVLLENRAPRLGQWTGIRLRQPGLNTRAIGASVLVTVNGSTTLRRSMRAGQGYLTGNAPEIHFGLGDVKSITAVEVIWPDGERTQHTVDMGTWQTITRP